MWFNLPEHSLELNDSIILHNYGNEDMPWVVDMIDNNASFETDPFYTARVFGPDHATTFNETEMKNITVFNSSVHDSASTQLPVFILSSLSVHLSALCQENGGSPMEYTCLTSTK